MVIHPEADSLLELRTKIQRQSRALHQDPVAERAYSMAFQTSEVRNRWLPRYLSIYNGRRYHMVLAGRTPIQQLGLLWATE